MESLDVYEYHGAGSRQALEEWYLADENLCVEQIIEQAKLSESESISVEARASILVKSVRAKRKEQGGIDAFLAQYDLSSEEGIALMCLAEALLRIPDNASMDKLIKEKIAMGNWKTHIGKSHSLFVNAATWALMLTGKIIDKPSFITQEKNLTHTLKHLASKGGEPIVRSAITRAMKILGRQFVMGRTIEEAIKRAEENQALGYRYSFDMLGEAAYTEKDAQKYFESYKNAIEEIAKVANQQGPINAPGISVKLSALHPRFTVAKRHLLKKELLPKLIHLVRLAKHANINLTIDAEEAHTLLITLELVQEVIEQGYAKEWSGFGIAIQAYQKRAPYLLDYIIHLLRNNQSKMMIRLVKGAYWDTEIKSAQVQGLKNYPVFTRKVATDVNYQVCIKKMLNAQDVIYSQFATHNALTLATVMECAKSANATNYEFQCLHGMGSALYDDLVANPQQFVPCRIYAPVGTHEELLAYLVRRLLENGANTSFVNRIVDESQPISEMVACPVAKLQSYESKMHPNIPLPVNLYQQDERLNSMGIDLSDPKAFIPILKSARNFSASALVVYSGADKLSRTRAIDTRYSPVDKRLKLGEVQVADLPTLHKAVDLACHAYATWPFVCVDKRATFLEKTADLLYENRQALFNLLICEGGKTLEDAISEWREAIDFCRYYATQARKLFLQPKVMPGPTGEENKLSLHSRGVILCISPWNFPLAIFLGQVAASLAAGNTVIAKPATQTMFIAAKAVEILHQAGFPKDVVQLLIGKGRDIGETLLKDPRIQGVVFTGSTETAWEINQTLAARKSNIVPFIAETGGINAMVVDSSALAEQVTKDVMASAFRSAGQRCSALRVLFLQEDVADKIIDMIVGAMKELTIGDPRDCVTDVGPIIDEQAIQKLQKHVEKMKDKAKLWFESALNEDCCNGSYFAPRIYEISDMSVLTEEVFGPVLHIIRFAENQLDEVIAQMNQTNFGLTLGIHSRIGENINKIIMQTRVGNIYVNRNMIGAVVGVQPFGGEGLSGTGPKAGGPHYLPRLAVERTVSTDTTASGGNATLMTLDEKS